MRPRRLIDTETMVFAPGRLRQIAIVGADIDAFAMAKAGPARAIEGEPCGCSHCADFNRRFPHDGRQLCFAIISSGGQPEAAPLPDPDAPAAGTAGVSAPVGRSVETPTNRGGARGHKPEPAHV